MAATIGVGAKSDKTILKKGKIAKQSKKLTKFKEFKDKRTRAGKVVLKNVKDVQKLIGLVGLYRRFVSNPQDIVELMVKLTRGDVKWSWGTEQPEAFAKLEAEYLN